jgi:hypothetical protein
MKKTVLWSTLALFILLGFIASCNEERLMRWTTPRESVATAQGYVDLLRQNQLGQIERDLNENITGPDTHASLIKMASLLPQETPRSIKVAGFHIYRNSISTTRDTMLEYEFSKEWILVELVMETSNGATSISGFHVTVIDDSLEHRNRFTLLGKGSRQYIVLLLGAVSLLISGWAVVLCARTKIEKHKWLWVILTLLGVGKLSVDWTTGETLSSLISVQVPTLSAFAALYGAWVVSAAFPLGGIIFLILLRRRYFEPKPQVVVVEPMEHAN